MSAAEFDPLFEIPEADPVTLHEPPTQVTPPHGRFFADLAIPPRIREFLTPKPWEAGILMGPAGTGKTAEACARLVGASVAADRAVGLFVSIPELLHRLRAAVGDPAAQDYELDLVLAAKHLVLDDLGAEKVTDWTRDRIYLIVNYRESRRLPTIVTTNLNVAGIRAFDERIASRLLALAPVQTLTGSDRRTWRSEPLEQNAPFLTDKPAPPKPAEPYVAPPTPEEIKRVEKAFGRIYANMGLKGGAAEFAALVQKAEPEQRLMPRGDFNGRVRELVRRATAGEKFDIRAELEATDAA
ncbi:MAG TPA: ATP-binding protein [Thermoanaerobaculia bacterium]|nr:ATP-binding protein [Thermoanaerobaculia bacterium]